jgi:hypothetical protein
MVFGNIVRMWKIVYVFDEIAKRNTAKEILLQTQPTRIFYPFNFSHKHYDSNSSLLVEFGGVWFRLGMFSASKSKKHLKSNNNFCSAKSRKILITTKPIIAILL